MSHFTIDPGIEAKGRNGYFKAAKVRVTYFRPVATYPDQLNIQIVSAREGDGPPIQVSGKPEDVIKLLQRTLIEAKKEFRLQKGGRS